MLNLIQVEKFLERLPIRDRDSGKQVNFRLNPNQKIVMQRLQKHTAQKKPLWFILLKSRRVGMSALSDALLTCHCLSKPNAEALIVAHQYKSSTALFKIPQMLIGGLPFPIERPNQHKIVFPHDKGHASLALATAGSTQGGRGLTLSALHLSEAAFFPGIESFTSLIPAVSYSTDTICIIESTANGRIGPGEAFYQYWQAATEERNEFLPIFLSWLDDPGAFRPSEFAKDAPADNEEKDLIKIIKARGDHSHDQMLQRVAWRRWTLETKCQGYAELFHQEYPITEEEAFISTGEPAFDKMEISFARASLKKADAIGEFVRHGRDDIKLEPSSDGQWHVWEYPQSGMHYYIGADAARGEEQGESGQMRATGDFASMVVWNGDTGNQAARYAAKINPERLADECDKVGRFYNRGMVNIELTGNLGLWAQTLLRDRYAYPNLYRWKGRDDRIGKSGTRSAIGWETTQRTREIAFNAFRAALREERVFVRDKGLLTQMDAASRKEGFRWDVVRGHDDILMAALVGWIAREQWAPPRALGSTKPDYTEDDAPMRIKYVDDLQFALMRHYDKIMAVTKVGKRPNTLEGI